mmetsp:Transcript_99492/g.121705  ORF Transcript_99492/g.121705 Transcript_99492/m.121705 type:complete len:277 (+) Transcript_99492:253-1083(+)
MDSELSDDNVNNKINNINNNNRKRNRKIPHSGELFALKLLALMQTSFKHVLWLDSDNDILDNPSTLFNSIQYKRYNAIFWPDLFGIDCLNYHDKTDLTMHKVWSVTNQNCSIWKVFNIEFDKNNLKHNHTMESGQMVLNTKKYFHNINQALYCTLSQFYQTYIYGDKDCFRLVWLHNNSPFYFVPFQPGFVSHMDNKELYLFDEGHIIAQKWENENKIIFLHRKKKIHRHKKLWEGIAQMNQMWTCFLGPFRRNIDTPKSYTIKNVEPFISALEIL